MQDIHAHASGHKNDFKKQNVDGNRFKRSSRKRRVDATNKPPSRCDDCDVPLNSVITAEMHFKGKKHAHILALKRKWSLSDNAVVERGPLQNKNIDEKTENSPSSSTTTTKLANTHSAVSGENQKQYMELSKNKCTSDGEIMKVKHSKATVLCNSKPLSACFVNATYKDQFALTPLPKHMSLASSCDNDFGRKLDSSETSDLRVENPSAIDDNSDGMSEKTSDGIVRNIERVSVVGTKLSLSESFVGGGTRDHFQPENMISKMSYQFTHQYDSVRTFYYGTS